MSIHEEYFRRLACGPPFSRGEEMKYELARLASFTTWPPWARVRPTELASAGFYYTGNSDHVTCFSCGVNLGDWQVGQNPDQEHRRRNEDCDWVRGIDSNNHPWANAPDPYTPENETNHESMAQICSLLPEPRDTEEELQRTENHEDRTLGELLEHVGVVASIDRSPTYDDNSLTSLLPPDRPLLDTTSIHNQLRFESYRLGTFQGWPETSFVGPPELAKNGFFYLGTLDRVKCAFCDVTLANWRPGDEVGESHRRQSRLCSFVRGMDVENVSIEEEMQPIENEGSQTVGVVTEHAKFPAYAAEADRVTSFRKWPKEAVIGSRELAQAGLFYTGDGDKCKCFSCGGGLMSWEAIDEPWLEHARWYPDCGFVLARKGPDYIRRVQLQDNATHPPPPESVTPASAALHRVLFPVERSQVRAQMTTPLVQSVLTMGFPERLVETVIEERLATEGSAFPGEEPLLEALCLASDRAPSVEPQRADPEWPPAGHEDRPSDPAGEYERVMELRLCKVCMDSEVNIVFLPCGHLVCCGNCASAVRLCPICRQAIRGTVRVFLS